MSKSLKAFVTGGSSPPESKLFEKRIGESSNLKVASESWLSTKDAAAYLGISAGSLRNSTSNGKIPYFKFGRLNRYRKSDLDKILFSEKRGGEFL